MNNIKLKQIIIDVLKSDDRLWNEDKTELNQTLLLDLVENIDEKLIELLLQEKELRDKFFVKIKDVYVFKTNDFRFFIEENKVDNSYTQYKNRIGLTDGKRFLKDTNDVVLNWPYKDCVLEGGQSTEEGLDTYFEYDETVTKAQEKQGLKAGTYNKKTAKRKEIFFNSVLAHDEIDRLFDHKALTNWKRFTKDGEQEVGEIKRDEDGTIRENLIIKGNNLLALHSLKKQFAGKVKLIYIDPPYNTGSDSFAYNDKFNHSTWLTFMKNRLEVSKDMLRSDGVIFVHCDDNEQAYLKVLLDEIYGRENFVNSIAVLSSTPSGLKTAHRNKTIIKTKDYILVYKKGNVEFKPQYTPVDEWDTHFNYYFDKENNKVIPLKDIIVENKIYPPEMPAKDYSIKDKKFLDFVLQNSGNIFQTGKSMPEDIREISLKPENKDIPIKYITSSGEVQYAYNGRRMSFLSNSIKEILIGNKMEKMICKLVCDFWDDIDFNNSQNEGGVSFPAGKKPEKLLYRIIDMVTDEGDIILDFFAGSGTTLAVAHKMNRQYIGIEQLDYQENDSVVRLKNVINGDETGISGYEDVKWQGGGEFIYCELAKWNEKAKEEILDCESLEELEAFFDEMYERYFLNYNLKIKEFKEKVLKEENFRNLSLDEQKKIFVAMLDNNQMYVNKTEMADKKFGISEEDQNLTNQFYNKEE